MLFLSFISQLRPPQPAVYLYLLDVSFNAVKTGMFYFFLTLTVPHIILKMFFYSITSAKQAKKFSLILHPSLLEHVHTIKIHILENYQLWNSIIHLVTFQWKFVIVLNFFHRLSLPVLSNFDRWTGQASWRCTHNDWFFMLWQSSLLF